MRVSALLLLLLLLAPALVQAQGKATVIVVDARTGEPLARAAVRILCPSLPCPDSSRQRVGVMADGAGRAGVAIDGRAVVAVNYAGYERMLDTIAPGQTHTLRLIQKPGNSHVVVTGQYRPTSADRSIHPVRIITAEAIRAQGATTAREALQNTLNTRISTDAVLGSTLAIGGVAGQNVKILVDGVPVIGRLNGAIDLGQLPMHNVERIEIVEGPLSTIYGTDALGGVVNIITRNRAAQRFEGEVGGMASSVGEYTVDARAGLRFDGGSVVLSGVRNLFQGWSPEGDVRAKLWKPREQYDGELAVHAAIGEIKTRYSGQVFSDYILNRGMPRAPYGESAFDDTYRTLRITNTLGAGTAFSPADALDLSASFSHYRRMKNSTVKNLVTLEERPTIGAGDQDTSGYTSLLIRTVYNHTPDSSWIEWQSGAEMTADRTWGGRILGGERTLEDVALFTSIRLTPLENLTVQPAVRGGYNSRYPAPVVPSLNLRYDLAEGLAVRASYARGFRAPSLRELYLDFVDINHDIHGNENLRAERSHNVMAGGALRRLVADMKVTADVGGFYNDITDMIALAQVEGSLYRNVNIDRLRTLGGTATVGVDGGTIAVEAGTALTGRSAAVEGEGVPGYTWTPEVNGTVRATLPVLNTKLSVMGKYTGSAISYYLNAQGAVAQSKVDPYSMLDLSLAQEVFGTATVTLGVRNLFDVRSIAVTGSSGGVHSSGGDIPVGMGRTFFGTLRLRLGNDQ